MTKRITLRIGPNGEVRADVSGFRGKSCVDYISVLEKMLDAETVDSQPTDEYYSDQASTAVEPLQDDLPPVRQPLINKE